MHTAIKTRGWGQHCRDSPCTYDGDGFHLEDSKHVLEGQ
jgi:hypothetical protein